MRNSCFVNPEGRRFQRSKIKSKPYPSVYISSTLLIYYQQIESYYLIVIFHKSSLYL